MQVDQLTALSTTAGTTGSTAAGKAKIEYDAFLQLLVAELSNQDPTQPMDSTKYVSQLATFSQVEQSVQANSKLDTMISSNQLILAESLIGNSITSADGTQSGEITSVMLTSDGAIAILRDGSELAIGPGVTIA